MTEQNSTPETGDVAEQIEEVFKNLTAEQMIQNDLDTAKTARDFRKIAQGALMSAVPPLSGRSGLTAEEKVAMLDMARARLMLAVKALDEAITLAEAPKKEGEA